MRHAKPYRKLSRQRSHYTALMRNLALSLFEKERIRTTLTKAKEMRGFVEGIIELGKTGGLHNRRRAFALMGNKTISTSEGDRRDPLVKVFGELATRYASRKGGYTRIYKLGNRPGDAAPMALIELVDAKLEVVSGKPEATQTEAKPKKESKAKAKKASAKDAA
jgi:large subunit ribosomal protein L17